MKERALDIKCVVRDIKDYDDGIMTKKQLCDCLCLHLDIMVFTNKGFYFFCFLLSLISWIIYKI